MCDRIYIYVCIGSNKEKLAYLIVNGLKGITK